MFNLTAENLQGRILGCADGPASFNAEAAPKGIHVISCDPLYRCSRDEISVRLHATYEPMLEQARRNQSEFIWKEFKSVEELGRARWKAMQIFLEDYGTGKREGRYIPAELPTLGFQEQSFDLAFCSHYLFLYTDQLTETFHVEAIQEMCRVAREARLFPLLALSGERSKYVEPVMRKLQESGYHVSIQSVRYEFRRGENEMMCIWT